MKADFIDESTEIRESFSFAQPNQILEAVRMYCWSLYGSMTRSLYSDKANQVFNCWSTWAKLAWGVTRATHSYTVDNLLSAGLPSLRSCVLARFCKFIESVQNSKSMEVSLAASLSVGDMKPATGSNCAGIRKQFKVQNGSMLLIRGQILDAKRLIPAQDTWRHKCLMKYLEQKYQLQAALEDTEEIDQLIESLCAS